MRELTGHEDKQGRPIVEGDILRTDEGAICTVRHGAYGWLPFFLGLTGWEQARIEVIGSQYTAAGRKILADWRRTFSTRQTRVE
jgi:hypothetical protein